MNLLHVDNAMRVAVSCSAIMGVALFPASALAYVGPGAGLSVIGSLLAFVAAIIVAIFGFLFFPIRRILRRRKQKAAQKSAGNSPAATSDQSGSGKKPELDGDPQRNPEA
jgi:membrane-bound ClpP family serine protease